MSETAPDKLASIRALLPEAVSRLPAPVRHRAENALDGFSRAKALLPIDREMASFRALTAAEEAASALIRSLQLRDYPEAMSINLKSHGHKAAVPFFLHAVREELAIAKPTLVIALSPDPPELTISLPLRQFVKLPENRAGLHLELAHPLDLVGTRPGVESGDYFDRAVQRAAGSRKVDSVIRSAANVRNLLLYAHDAGRPSSKVTLQSIEKQERAADACILLAIAVLQVEHHQGFALQCLTGFLKVIRRADSADPLPA